MRGDLELSLPRRNSHSPPQRENYGMETSTCACKSADQTEPWVHLGGNSMRSFPSHSESGSSITSCQGCQLHSQYEKQSLRSKLRSSRYRLFLVNHRMTPATHQTNALQLLSFEARLHSVDVFSSCPVPCLHLNRSN